MEKERINISLDNYDYNFTINKPEGDTFYGQSVTDGITGAMLMRSFEFINKEDCTKDFLKGGHYGMLLMLRAVRNWLKKMSGKEDWEIDVMLDDYINTDEELRDPILQVAIDDRVLEMDNDDELDPDLIPDPEDALIKPDLKLVKKEEEENPDSQK
jgi:hypothetical protein